MKEKPKFIINVYVETEINPYERITTEITSDNTYILCPECGKKHHINISEILEFNYLNFDMRHFEADYLLCKKCNKSKGNKAEKNRVIIVLNANGK